MRAFILFSLIGLMAAISVYGKSCKDVCKDKKEACKREHPDWQATCSNDYDWCVAECGSRSSSTKSEKHHHEHSHKHSHPREPHVEGFKCLVCKDALKVMKWTIKKVGCSGIDHLAHMYCKIAGCPE